MRRLTVATAEGAPDCDVCAWPRWVPPFIRALSMTFAPLRRIYVADHIIESGTNPKPLMCHEMTHYVRAWSYGPWRWMAAYVFSRAFRLNEEMWGETAEAVARIGAQLRPIGDDEVTSFIDCPRLHGWQWPYFTGARKEDVQREVTARVKATLAADAII